MLTLHYIINTLGHKLVNNILFSNILIGGRVGTKIAIVDSGLKLIRVTEALYLYLFILSEFFEVLV